MSEYEYEYTWEESAFPLTEASTHGRVVHLELTNALRGPVKMRVRIPGLIPSSKFELTSLVLAGGPGRRGSRRGSPTHTRLAAAGAPPRGRRGVPARPARAPAVSARLLAAGGAPPLPGSPRALPRLLLPVAQQPQRRDVKLAETAIWILKKSTSKHVFSGVFFRKKKQRTNVTKRKAHSWIWV